MNSESVPLEWHGKHAEDNPSSGLAASHTAVSYDPTSESSQKNELSELGTILLGIILGISLSINVLLIYSRWVETSLSRLIARLEADDVLAEIKIQAEMTAPPSTLPSIMEDLKAALEGLSRLEQIRLLTILLNRYQYEQYAESAKMIEKIRETLNGLSDINLGYDSLIESPRYMIYSPYAALLKTDADNFHVNYVSLFLEFMELNQDNLHTRDNQEISDLCTKISKYYQVSLGIYFSHSCSSKYPIE